MILSMTQRGALARMAACNIGTDKVPLSNEAMVDCIDGSNNDHLEKNVCCRYSLGAENKLPIPNSPPILYEIDCFKIRWKHSSDSSSSWLSMKICNGDFPIDPLQRAACCSISLPPNSMSLAMLLHVA